MAMTLFVACDKEEEKEKEKDNDPEVFAAAVGTYEMVSIEGYMTQNGTRIELNESMYEYYRIILRDDGTAKVASKAPNNSTIVEQEGTWKYEDGKVKLISSQYGISVTEVMDWENGTITYHAQQSGGGITADFVLVLEKQ